MSSTQYLIWFIATSLVTTGLLVAFVLASMGWFERHEKGFVHQAPNEPTTREAYERHRRAEQGRPTHGPKQYWPHVRHT